jgi:DNA-binding response OmpR family regulator
VAHAVLLVEDDDVLREVVAHNLASSGFSVLEARSVAEATEAWQRADVVVLDWMLPDEPGLRLLARARAADDDKPVLVLTAKAREADRVEGLETGADDYLVKPFSHPELVARLRALLRRARVRRAVRLGELEVDEDAGEARLAGVRLELTPREFELLAFLVANAGRVFARGELLDRVWGADFVGTERTVDQHVSQLRAQLGQEWIETVRGRGYRMARPGGAG